MRLGDMGAERPVVQDEEGQVFDHSPLTRDIDGAFLTADGMAQVRNALQSGCLEPVSAAGLRVGPPVAQPGALVCIGQNYAAHALESGAAPPEQPIIFLKHPNTIVGPFDAVRIPARADKVDWEVELAVVMGRRARYLSSPEEAAACIAGYTISNDVSERDLQRQHSGGQWSKGKCCETFNLLGPALVPTDSIADVRSLRFRSWVNGEPRQDSTTRRHDLRCGDAGLAPVAVPGPRPGRHRQHGHTRRGSDVGAIPVHAGRRRLRGRDRRSR